MGSSASVDLFTTESIPNLEGKIAIVTGGNTGIGYAIAKGLASKKATVVIASRSKERVDEAVQKLRSKTRNNSVFGELVDLSSFDSITAFTTSMARKYDCVDILIDNAAVFLPKHSKTFDGFEITLGVNSMGNILITKQLLPLLRRSTDARIVFLGSGPASPSNRLFERIVSEGDLGGERLGPSDTNFDVLTLSKLFLTMYCFELQRRLTSEGVHNVFIANSFPGLINSGGGRDADPDLFIIHLFRFLAPMLGKSTEVGSLSALFLATAPKAVIERYRGATAGPGPKIQIANLANPDITPTNCERVFDLIESIIQSKIRN